MKAFAETWSGYAAILLLCVGVERAYGEWLTLQVPISRSGHGFYLWELDVPGQNTNLNLLQYPGEGGDNSTYVTSPVEYVEVVGGTFDAQGNWFPSDDSYIQLQVQRLRPEALYFLKDTSSGQYGPPRQNALVFSQWRDPGAGLFHFFAIEAWRYDHEFTLWHPATSTALRVTKGNVQRAFDHNGTEISLNFFEAWSDVDDSDYQLFDLTEGTALAGPVSNTVGLTWQPSTIPIPSHQFTFILPLESVGQAFTVFNEQGASEQATAQEGSFYPESGVEYTNVGYVTGSAGQWTKFWLQRNQDDLRTTNYYMAEQNMFVDVRVLYAAPPPHEPQWNYQSFRIRDTHNLGSIVVKHEDGTEVELSTDWAANSLYSWDEWGNSNSIVYYNAYAVIDTSQNWWLLESGNTNLGQGNDIFDGWSPSINSNPANGDVWNDFPTARQGHTLQIFQNGTWTFGAPATTFTMGGYLGPGGEWVQWDVFSASAHLNDPWSSYEVYDLDLADSTSGSSTAFWFPRHPLILKVSATRWSNDLRIRTGSGAEYPVTRHKVQGTWSLDLSGRAWFNQYGFFDATSETEEGVPWWLVDYSHQNNGPEVLIADTGDASSFINATDNTDTDGDGWADWYEKFVGTDPTLQDTDGDGIIDSQDPYPRSLPVTASSTLQVWTPLR
jgi:hypothetical protein